MSRLPSWARDVVVAGSGGRVATLIPTRPRGTSRQLHEAQRLPAGRVAPGLSDSIMHRSAQKASHLVSSDVALESVVWRIRRGAALVNERAE